MIMKHLLFKQVICIFGLILMIVSNLYATDEVPKQDSGLLPLDKVTKYLEERIDATTYQNNKVEAELLGRQYSGVITVYDVVEFDGDLMIYGWQEIGRGAELRFLIKAPNNKEKAGVLRKRDSIIIVGTLDFFYNEESGYFNVSDTYIASFKDVQRFEVQSKKE